MDGARAARRRLASKTRRRRQSITCWGARARIGRSRAVAVNAFCVLTPVAARLLNGLAATAIHAVRHVPGHFPAFDGLDARVENVGAGRSVRRKTRRRPATVRAGLNGGAKRSTDGKPELRFAGLRK